jgi:two-component system chemotaxis response regulator CheB
VVALHIPAEYTGPLAERLNRQSAAQVLEATDGLELGPGMIAIAPGGKHTRVQRVDSALVCEVSAAPRTSLYHPSIDELFRSAARACNSRLLAVVLTGMGDDGLSGCQKIRASGGVILTESAESCAVYGMPRSVDQAGLSDASVRLELMPAEILARL